MWKLQDSRKKDKMFEVVLDIKREVEGFTGKQFDLGKCVDDVENDNEKNSK